MASLELRLECRQRLGNLHLDFIERLYDRAPVDELYGELDPENETGG